MSESFISKNTPSLDKIVNDATTQGEDIGAAFERMKAELRGAMGMTAPPSENEVLYGRSTLPAQTPLPVQSSGSHIRVVYPSGNSRFEIYGDSEESLDLQEARIRAMYGVTE
jgi:hypothetical protein